MQPPLQPPQGEPAPGACAAGPVAGGSIAATEAGGSAAAAEASGGALQGTVMHGGSLADARRPAPASNGEGRQGGAAAQAKGEGSDSEGPSPASGPLLQQGSGMQGEGGHMAATADGCSVGQHASQGGPCVDMALGSGASPLGSVGVVDGAEHAERGATLRTSAASLSKQLQSPEVKLQG